MEKGKVTEFKEGKCKFDFLKGFVLEIVGDSFLVNSRKEPTLLLKGWFFNIQKRVH